MAITYDTLGSTVTVEPSGFVPASDLNTNVALVGGYDAANATATAGEVTTVNTSTEAGNEFGSDSELARGATVAIRNGTGQVYGVPLPETEQTESFSGTASGTLSNTPVMDPTVHPDEDITATDTTDGTDVSVSIVYEETPSQPTESDAINLNPINGEWAADASSDYDITYTYGDFETALAEAVTQPVRYVIVGTEAPSVKTTLLSKLNEEATNFAFKRGIVGATPDIQSGEISGYTPSEEDWRLIETAPARATSADGAVRSAFAVGGLLSAQPINVEGSITYDDVTGLTDLNVEYTPTTAETFEQVTALTRDSIVAAGVTTSAEQSFRDIYKAEIIDYVVEQVYGRVRDYKGGSNADGSQKRFRSRLKRTLNGMAAPDATPPLLADGDGGRPYAVSVATGSVDTETDVDIGIDPAPIAKEVAVNISVGPLRFNGVEV